MTRTISIVGLIILLLTTAGFTIFFAVSVWNNFDSAIKSSAIWESTGQVGDFVGGVIGTLVSAIGSILIYMTLMAQNDAQNNQNSQFNTAFTEQANANQAQRQEFNYAFTEQIKANKDQRNEFLRSEIEGRFFELLRLQNNNLTAVIYDNDADNENPLLTERKAIQFIVKQIETCYAEIALFFKRPKPAVETVYKPEHIAHCEKLTSIRKDIDLIKMAHLDIAYSIVFFGTSEKDMPSLKKLLKRYYQDIFFNEILAYIELKSVNTNRREAWMKFQNTNPDYKAIVQMNENFRKYGYLDSTPIPDEQYHNFNLLSKPGMFDKYYGGHQYKLGHYFRHLFQTVKYINSQQIISYHQKYDYLKTLRAQLSTIEQYLIFYNSISFMGRAWELESVSAFAENRENPTELNNWFFTKYNFIKNIPDLEPIAGLNITDYYPEMHFEFENEPEARKTFISSMNVSNSEIQSI